MIARTLTIVLIALLALPVAAMTRPAEASKDSRPEVSAEAKAKKKKKQRNRLATPQFTTVTKTVRQPVTRIFANTGSIAIPNGALGASSGVGSPYPSAIQVSGFTNGVITDVNLVLTDLTHTSLVDIDLLLSADSGRQALVMSDAGTSVTVATDIDLTLDDEAGAPLPTSGALTGGSFQPANFNGFADSFPDPAPALSGDVALSTFDGVDPNGTWQIWVNDQGGGDIGDMGGWALEITAESDVQIEEQVEVPAAQDTKDKKGKKQKKDKGRR